MICCLCGATPGRGRSTQRAGHYTYWWRRTRRRRWGSFHRSVGVDAASAITVHCGEAPHNFHDMESDHPSRILDKCASAMATLGQNNATIAQGEYFVALGPEHAATCASAGWSRRDVSSYLFQMARLPARVFRAQFDLRAWFPWMHGVADDEMLPMTAEVDPSGVVCGGAGKHECVRLGHASALRCRSMTGASMEQSCTRRAVGRPRHVGDVADRLAGLRIGCRQPQADAKL